MSYSLSLFRLVRKVLVRACWEGSLLLPPLVTGAWNSNPIRRPITPFFKNIQACQEISDFRKFSLGDPKKIRTWNSHSGVGRSSLPNSKSSDWANPPTSRTSFLPFNEVTKNPIYVCTHIFLTYQPKKCICTFWIDIWYSKLLREKIISFWLSKFKTENADTCVLSLTSLCGNKWEFYYFVNNNTFL